MNKLWLWIRCNVLRDHDWTCKADAGIKPTDRELNTGMLGFCVYAAGYCRHCRKMLPPAVTAIEQATRDGQTSWSDPP